MKKKYLILLILIILASIISCNKKNSGSDNTDQAAVITNEKPTNPIVTLKFCEELCLSEQGWWPANMLVDDGGNIYVFGEVENSVHKYNAEGELLLKKVFPKGQGPGDFMFMDPYFSYEGRIFIYDKQQHRISILDQNCELIESYKTEGAKYLLRMDSKDNMYFWVGKSSLDKSTHVLTKFSSAGKKIHEIFEYVTPRPEFVEDKSMFIWPLYYRSAIYKLDSHDNVYYSLITEYRINKLSPDGRLLKTIVKKGQTRKVTERDIEEVSPQVEERQDIRTVFLPPENVPCIADFFILENDYLLVITMKMIMKKIHLQVIYLMITECISTR